MINFAPNLRFLLNLKKDEIPQTLNMFISVKEAADLTGKSSTTIYRLCNKRINTNYVRKEDNKFLINRDFLLATYPPGSTWEDEVLDTEKNLTSENNENEIISTSINKNDLIKNTDDKIKNLNTNNSQTKIDEEPKIKEINNKSESATDENIPKSFFSNILSWEVIIGVSVSLLIIAIFIYLLAVIE